MYEPRDYKVCWYFPGGYSTRSGKNSLPLTQGWSTHTRTCTRTYSSTFFSVLSCILYLAKFMSTCTRTYLSTVTKDTVLMSTL